MATLPNKFSRGDVLKAADLQAMLEELKRLGGELRRVKAGSGAVRLPATATVVVTRVPQPNDPTLTVRKVRYANTPPCGLDDGILRCGIEWASEDMEAHPDFGLRATDYESYYWNPTSPPSEATIYLRGRYEYGTVVVEYLRSTLNIGCYLYVQMEADVLICRSWDGESPGDTDIRIAKPYLLRRTVFDGQTRDGWLWTFDGHDSVTVTKTGAQTERWRIVPAYRAGDVIWAVAGILRRTLVDDASVLDLNVDGRAWAKVSDSAGQS